MRLTHHSPTLETKKQRLERPQIDYKTRKQRWTAVFAVLRREIKSRMLTHTYLWSTLTFAAVAFFTPALLNRNRDEASVLVIPPEANSVSRILELEREAPWSLMTAENTIEARNLVSAGHADAYLTRSEDNGWSLISAEPLDDRLLTALESSLDTHALTSVALEAGASRVEINESLSDAIIDPLVLDTNSVDTQPILFALGIGITVIFIVLLWGSTMANDVVQEKTTRVVEILIATLRPWQLLAGKILATTIIGTLQVAAILFATWGGLKAFGHGISFAGVPVELFIAGVFSILIGVPLLTSLMAALASRVDHIDDVSTATQPAYLLLMLPFAMVIYVVFGDSSTELLEALSYTPIVNIFAMPFSVVVNGAHPWQMLTSFGIGLATLAGIIALAGRAYSNSILRSGAIVSLRDAFTSC